MRAGACKCWSFPFFLKLKSKRHNFVDTLSDSCLCKKGIKDTHHFFLVSPFFNAHRKTSKTNVAKILDEKNIAGEQLSVNLLLYGHKLLPSDTIINVRPRIT